MAAFFNTLFMKTNPTGNYFLEVFKCAKGAVVIHINDIFKKLMKCNCFGYDCCNGFMKEPTADGSTKVYSSIIGDVKTYFTLEEMEAYIAENGKAKAGGCPDGGC